MGIRRTYFRLKPLGSPQECWPVSHANWQRLDMIDWRRSCALLSKGFRHKRSHHYFQRQQTRERLIWNAFMKRKPELSLKTPELSRGRAIFGTPQAINKSFYCFPADVLTQEEGAELLKDPFTGESGLSLCAKAEKVVVMGGCRSLYQISRWDRFGMCECCWRDHIPNGNASPREAVSLQATRWSCTWN